MQIILGVLIPFLGTILGASMVFFIKNNICSFLEKFLLGFASGIMIAASIWSLIIPAIELSKDSGIIHYIPVMVCENCFRKRKIAIIFIYILFLLVIPVFFFIKGGFAAGIVLFFIGLAISGYSSSLSEKLFISLDEALKIQKDQDAYGIDNIIDDM